MKKPALIYLIRTKVKNMLLELVRKPARLIYFLLIIALFGFMLFGSGHDADAGEVVYRSVGEFYAIVFAIYMLIFIFTAQKGFHDGGNLFSLPDVNLVFPAPFRPQSILLYGMFQQLGTSLLVGIFIPFQYGWVSALYDISIGTMLWVTLGYALATFAGQLLAMVFYSFTSMNPKRKRVVSGTCISLLVLYLVFIGLKVLRAGDPIAAVSHLATALPTRLFPITGWLMSVITGLMEQNTTLLLLYGGLYLLFIFGFILLIQKSNPDYYEDVLKTAEVSYSAITAKKQGTVQESVPQNIKVGETGLSKGWGADAIYYKHKLENRRARVFLLDSMSLIYALITIAFAVILKVMIGENSLIAIFSFATYMQLFSVALGRFTRELLKPYIYLIPESSYKKLISAMREGFSRHVAEALFTFIPIGLIMGATVVDVAACILARITFSFLFTAINVLLDRVFGTISSKGLIMFLYIIFVTIASVPGILLAIFLPTWGVVLINGTVTGFLAMCICNIPIGFLILFLCRNMLQYAEFNNA